MSDYPQKDESLTAPENSKRINPYKAFTGSFVPQWLEVRQEISPGSKLVYARLARFAGKDGKCNPKLDTLADALGTNKRQALRFIEELKKYKLIESIRNGLTRSNDYYFLWSDWMDLSLEQSDNLSLQEVPDLSLQEVPDLSLQEVPDLSLHSNMNKENHLRESLEDKKDVFLKNKKTSKKLLFSIQDYFEVIENKLESLGQSRMLNPLRESFENFFQHRIDLHENDKKKCPLLNKTSTNILVKSLVEESNLDHKRANKMMEKAILNGWRGVHPVGHNGKQSKNGREKDDLSVDDNPYAGFF